MAGALLITCSRGDLLFGLVAPRASTPSPPCGKSRAVPAGAPGRVVTGVAGALLITCSLGNLLFGISTKDPLTFGTAWLPAYKASRIDPVTALRQE